MIYRVENKMTLFTNAELGNVRVLEIDGEPYFVGKDVTEVLGYQNGSRDINRHVDAEDRRKAMVFDGNQDKETILINESGLYSLILSSKLPKAKEFKHWITAEVLPVIRKTGGYVNDTKQFVDYYFADCNTYGREAITLMLNETKRMANQLKAQRYRAIGNGWTAEVIIHILNHALKDVLRDEELVVLSMYDGIATGRYCLDKMGFTNVKYYAYEIDPYAIKIAMSNYPDIVQCGDAFQIRNF